MVHNEIDWKGKMNLEDQNELTKTIEYAKRKLKK